MKKKKISILILLGITIMSTVSLFLTPKNAVVEANSATSYTYAVDTRGRGIVRTQDAYLPNRNISDLGIGAISDMKIGPNTFVADGPELLYIVAQHTDSENKLKQAVIDVFDTETKKIVYTITDSNFQTPTGIFLETKSQRLYVADSTAGKVFIFTINVESGEYKIDKIYEKPESVLLGDRAFKPNKISADQYGNMYIYDSGYGESIIQLDRNGFFLGYFSTNKLVPTLLERINKFFGIETSSTTTKNSVPLFNNVFTASDNLTYTVTTSTETGYPLIKKHDTSGAYRWGIGGLWFNDTSPKTIFVDHNKVIYVGMASGRIYAYTKEGELLYIFGGSSGSSSISGLFSSKGISGLVVDKNNTIWAADDNGTIVSFNTTDYAERIFAALHEGDLGNYEKSIEMWKEVLKLSQSSALAHREIGMNYHYNGQNSLAMYHLQIARDRYNYSQAFWEVRNIWLQNNLSTILIIALSLAVVYFVIKKLNQKTAVFAGVKQFKEKVTNNKLVSDLIFQTQIIKSPMDNFYYLKAKKKGSNLASTIILLVTFVAFLWFTLGKGFLYQFVETIDIDLFALVLGYFGIFALLVICNWLVTSIQYGEGNFGAIYRMTCSALYPWLVSMVVIAIASHFMTYNEIFILQFVQYIGIGLTVFLYIKGIQETHYYNVKETLISLLLTILLIAVIVIIALLMIMLFGQMWEFLQIIVKEVFQ